MIKATITFYNLFLKTLDQICGFPTVSKDEICSFLFSPLF